MPLPAAGNSISLDQIHVELGETSGTTVSLGDTDVRNLASDTSGAIGMDQFFGLSSASNIEDVYSTFVYKGDGSTRNIVNGLNLSGDGGLVWIKNRDTTNDDHVLVDTARGVTKVLSSNTNAQESTDTDTITAFNNNGFSLGADVKVNTNNENYVAWAWKKQAGFFDIVTYNGTGSSQNISHNLGAVPGMIIIKARDKSESFVAFHRSAINASVGIARSSFVDLRSVSGASNTSTMWNNTDPTSSVFTVGSAGESNENNKTYVAYLFAHQANDDAAALISCGGYTGNGNDFSDAADGDAFTEVDCGFEPQFVMIKSTQISSGSGDWMTFDTMRGMSCYEQQQFGTGPDAYLSWNDTGNEDAENFVTPTATGFQITSNNSIVNENNGKYIYMAIRKGPMAAPTAGSQVISIDTNGSSEPYFDSAHPVDMVFHHRDSTKFIWARKNHNRELRFNALDRDGVEGDIVFDYMDGFSKGSFSNYTAFMFHESPKAFSTLCYRGTESNRTIAHTLGVAPELIAIKNKSVNDDWAVYYGDNTDHLHFSSVGTVDTDVTGEDSYWNDTSPTSSLISLGTNHDVNAANEFYFAFMFATVAGVTKVGTVNVTGATNVDCGFSNGSKFVMIKRYSSSGHWLVFDTTSGLVAGNDTYRKMDSSSDVITNADVIDPLNAGFSLTADFLNITNNGSGDYVFVAIAA